MLQCGPGPRGTTASSTPSTVRGLCEAHPQLRVEANGEECLLGDHRMRGIERGPTAARNAVSCHVNIV